MSRKKVIEAHLWRESACVRCEVSDSSSTQVDTDKSLLTQVCTDCTKALYDCLSNLPSIVGNGTVMSALSRAPPFDAPVRPPPTVHNAASRRFEIPLSTAHYTRRGRRAARVRRIQLSVLERHLSSRADPTKAAQCDALFHRGMPSAMQNRDTFRAALDMSS